MPHKAEGPTPLMSKKLLTLLGWTAWAFLVMNLFAGPALAWGPGAHIECSNYILSNLALLAPALRKLLKAHPFAFIYGSIYPDMVLGKRFMDLARNNHQWANATKIWDDARAPRERAFALGYLSHLAADTVAHNHFVPDRLLHQFDHLGRSHFMQELLFDALLEDEVWRTARNMARKNFSECQALIERNLGPTPLPGVLNRNVFRGAVYLMRIGGWARFNRIVRRGFPDELEQIIVAPYLERIHQAAIGFLNDPERAPCLHESPAGGEVLPRALQLKKTLKRMRRKAILAPELHSELVGSFQQWREAAPEGRPAEL